MNELRGLQSQGIDYTTVWLVVIIIIAINNIALVIIIITKEVGRGLGIDYTTGWLVTLSEVLLLQYVLNF